MFLGRLDTRIGNLEKRLQTIPESIEFKNKISNLENEIKVLKNQINKSVVVPERCDYIFPWITYPSSNTEVSSSVKLKGQVKRIPTQHHIWILVYNKNINSYCDIERIIPNPDKEWEKEIRLTGGKVGDKYDIDIVLANDEENSALVEYRQSKKSFSVPTTLNICCQIVLKLKE